MARILIVDDDPDTCDMLARLVRGAGYDVVTAADGSEAMAAVEASGGTVDLILLDVMMPGVDGPAFLKRLRDSGADTSPQVLVMSAAERHYVEDRVAGLGVQDVLTKSTDFVPKLVEALDRYVGASDPPPPQYRSPHAERKLMPRRSRPPGD
jgi:CheY-like chemotaxis protein